MMGGKYYINGQLEMLLCWRNPKKAVAAGNGSPYMATEISSDFIVLYPYALCWRGVLQ